MNPTKLTPREWAWVLSPRVYQITCDVCQHDNIEWSEYEGRIWCYDCKVDTVGTGGIFSGPIPWEGTKLLLGPHCFHRYDIKKNCILEPVMVDGAYIWQPMEIREVVRRKQ